jgi:hypothetical protein
MILAGYNRCPRGEIVHERYDVEWPGIESGPSRWRWPLQLVLSVAVAKSHSNSTVLPFFFYCRQHVECLFDAKCGSA